MAISPQAPDQLARVMGGDPAAGMSDAEWLRENSERIVRYEEDAQRIRQIAKRYERLREALRAWEAWEGPALLGTWPESGGFSVTGKHYDRYIELQLMRSAALSEQEGK